MAVVAALALAAPAARASEPLDDAGYLAFADRVAAGLEIRWDEAAGAYVSRDKGATARTNANMLLVHAAAAAAAHTGAARHDDRARRIVERMTAPPMLAITRRWLPRNRSRCWRKRLDGGPRDHASVDSQVAEALEWAWRARAELQLPPELAAAARPRRPRLRARPAVALPARAEEPDQLERAARRRGRAHDGRRAAAARGLPPPPRPLPARRPPAAARHAHDQPRRGLRVPLQPGALRARARRTSTRRSTRTSSPRRCSTTARRSRPGCAPLPAADLERLTRWTTRLLLGNWTHAGYLNWDTGHGLHRLHSGQYWAWSMQGLLTIAAAHGVRRPARVPRVGQGAVRPRAAPLRALGRRGGDARSRRSCRSTWSPRTATTTSTRAGWPPTRCGRSGSASASRRPSTRRPSTRTTASSSGSPSRPRPTRPRSCRARTTRSSTAGSSSRGCSARAARWPRPPAACRPPRSACSSATRPTASCSPRQPGRPRGASLRLARGRVGSGSFRELHGRRADPGGAAARHLDVHVPAADDRRDLGGPLRRRLPAPRRRRGLPDLGGDGGDHRVRARPRPRRSSAPGALPVPLEGVGRIELGASPESGYSITGARGRAPTRCCARCAAPAPQRTVPHPGPALAVRLLQDGTLTGATLSVTLTPRGLRD